MKSWIILFLLSALLLPAGLFAATPDQKPNIVILLADDLRPDGLTSLGNPIVKTPNMDKLVSSGFIFRRAYVMGAMTPGVCMPSRTMLLTGMSMFRAVAAAPQPVRSDKGKPVKSPSGNTPDEFTFPRTMQAAGYATLHVGKKPLSPKTITDEFEESVDPGEAKRVADVAVDFIQRKAGTKPMFLYIAGHEPHDPQYAPDEYYARYKPEDMPLPKAFAPFHPFDNGAIKVRDEGTLPWPRTKEWLGRKLARYCASTEYWDTEMGRVLDALRKAGQFDNTIFIIAGDNGLSLGEHGLLGKQNLYEFGGMHVPLVFAGKGIPKGETRAIAYLMDVFPTICEMTGAHKPARADGLSLAPVIRGEKAHVRDFGFNAYTTTQRAVSDDRWKLIRYPLIGKTQLFDIVADPHEENDLSAQPEQAERINMLMAKLAELQKQYDDTSPLTYGKYRPAAWSPATLSPEDLALQAKETKSTFSAPHWLGGEKRKSAK